jgi:hypothetical protein
MRPRARPKNDVPAVVWPPKLEGAFITCECSEVCFEQVLS